MIQKIKTIIAPLFIGLLFFNSCQKDVEKVEIQMEKCGGVYQIPCKVNDVPMNFIFDTGASSVCISLTEALYLYKNGLISNSDIGGSSYSRIADGSIVENTHLNLKTIEIGGIVLHDIEAFVVSSLDAPLLLGQSAIQKLGSIQMTGNLLTIYPNDVIQYRTKSNNKSFLRSIVSWFNDGWYYEGEVTSTLNINPYIYTLKLYSKNVDGIIEYQVVTPYKDKYPVRQNENFGKEIMERGKMVIEDCNKCKYIAGKFYFNFPNENVEAELLAAKVHHWKLLRAIDMFFLQQDGLITKLTRESGNLYWRESDGKYMVVPCGEYTQPGYDYNYGKVICREPKNPRQLLVEQESHIVYYEEFRLYDKYGNFLQRYVHTNRMFTHKAGEYSFNM